MAKYTYKEFVADRDKVLVIIGHSLEYLGCDQNTYRVTVGDPVLKVFCDVYLSKRTLVIRTGKRQPRYFRKQTWEQVSKILKNIFNYLA